MTLFLVVPYLEQPNAPNRSGQGVWNNTEQHSGDMLSAVIALPID